MGSQTAEKEERAEKEDGQTKDVGSDGAGKVTTETTTADLTPPPSAQISHIIESQHADPFVRGASEGHPPSCKEEYPLAPQMVVLGHVPTKVTCSYCRSHVVTEASKEVGVGTFLVGLCSCCSVSTCASCCVCCFPYVVCGIPCLACVAGAWPFWQDRFKDTRHTCPNCKIELGQKKMATLVIST